MKKIQRNTKQRQLVLDAVRAHKDHPSADQIYLDVRTIDGKISRSTVYRNLNVLVKQGEILQVKLPHVDRFESGNDLHYHLLCIECGEVIDASLPYHEEMDANAAAKTGYVIKRHRMVFEGICSDCRKEPTK